MALEGKVFVIAGGGVAGEAVAAGLLRHGVTVAVTSRSEERLKSIREELDSPRLHCYAGDMASLTDAESLRDRILGTLGPIDGVVAALGGWWEGPPLTRLHPEIWHRILTDNLTSHFLVIRHPLAVFSGGPRQLGSAPSQDRQRSRTRRKPGPVRWCGARLGSRSHAP